MQPIKIILTPFSFIVDNARVDVLEISRSRLVDGSEVFHAVIQIHYKGITSKAFTLDVRDSEELVNKATVEVNKIKMFEYIYGLSEVKRLIT